MHRHRSVLRCRGSHHRSPLDLRGPSRDCAHRWLGRARIGKGMGLLGFGAPVWAIQVVECAERCAYYAVAFSLYTYLMNMLRMSMASANATINGVYIVIPLAACLASGIADGTTGQPRVLYFSICLYAAGLFLVAVSSLPCLYGDFPLYPSAASYAVFSTGLVLFSVGYGSMKVCTNPIMANAVRDSVRAEVATAVGVSPTSLPSSPREDRPGRAALKPDPTLVGDDTDVEAVDGGVAADCAQYDSRREDKYAVLPSPLLPLPPHTAASATAEAAVDAALEVLLPRLFRVTYWVSNFGALLGIFAAPLLRNLDSRTGSDGDVVFTTGYYWSFAFGFLAIVVGLYLYHRNQYRYRQNEPSPTFVLFRVVWRAGVTRVFFAIGRLHDDSFQQHTTSWLDYAAYPRERGPQDSTDVVILGPEQQPGYNTGDATASSGRPDAGPPSADSAPRYNLTEVSSPGWIEDCRVTLSVCKAFVALPVYWLICNQFSTNLMYQASALDLPSWVPPEMFNNINVFSLLLFLIMFEKVLVPGVFGGRNPPAVSRIVTGFALMVATMVWCGVVQIAVTKRGSYSSTEAYVLHPDTTKLSAGWLVVPYLVQGVASALVDPSVMEVAYTDAPERMKGQVLGLYWVASSVSGFLGVLLSPVMTPQNTTPLFFAFAAALTAATILFAFLNVRSRH